MLKLPGLAGALALGLLLALPAQAHRVNIFAFVDGDAVQVECGFNRSQKVRQGTVEIFDAATGARLAQGKTNDEGVYRFPVSQAVPGHDLTIRIMAGEGHQNEWTVAADELAPAAGQPATVPATVPASPAAAPVASQPVQAAPAAAPVSAAEVRQIVDAALDARLSPIRRMLAEQVEGGPTLRDVIGGIGWIFGLIGAAAYFRRPRV